MKLKILLSLGLLFLFLLALGSGCGFPPPVDVDHYELSSHDIIGGDYLTFWATGEGKWGPYIEGGGGIDLSAVSVEGIGWFYVRLPNDWPLIGSASLECLNIPGKFSAVVSYEARSAAYMDKIIRRFPQQMTVPGYMWVGGATSVVKVSLNDQAIVRGMTKSALSTSTWEADKIAVAWGATLPNVPVNGSTVSVIEGDNKAANINVDLVPYYMAYNPDTHKLYVLHHAFFSFQAPYPSSSVAVIDTRNNQLLKIIPIQTSTGGPALPGYVAVNRRENKIFVTGELGASWTGWGGYSIAAVWVINGDSDFVEAVKQIPTFGYNTSDLQDAIGSEPNIAINEEDNILYTTADNPIGGQPNVIVMSTSAPYYGFINAFEAPSDYPREVLYNPTNPKVYIICDDKDILVMSAPGTPETVFNDPSAGRAMHMAVNTNPSCNKIFVSNTGTTLDQYNITVISGETSSYEVTIAPPDLTLESTLGAMAVDTERNILYVNRYDSKVSVFHADPPYTYITTINNVKHPFWIGVNESSRRVYVTNPGSLYYVMGTINELIASVPTLDPVAVLKLIHDGLSDRSINPNTVTIINGNTNTIVSTFESGFLPTWGVIDPTLGPGGKCFVVNSGIEGVITTLTEGVSITVHQSPSLPPVIGRPAFNERAYVPQDIITPSPAITSVITDADTHVISTIEVWVDNTVRTYHGDASGWAGPSGTGSFNQATGQFSYTLGPEQSLAYGNVYTVTIKAADGLGHWSSYDCDVQVLPPPVKLISSAPGAPAVPISYPAIFKPLADPGNYARIAYSLNVPAEITIYMYDISGQIIFSRKYPAATPGGNPGYNEVHWNGISDLGGYVGNGIYFYKVISNKKVLGTGKIVVLD
ncbi:MAG: hypothetical protein NT030_02375 [Candidatus Saganbacteria bacterium]|nr:hypothetical protein [Candidatus Saganbacteria bacterium]